MTDARQLRFKPKPTPVLPDHRPLYKLAQVALILQLASRAGKSGLARLHLLNWALKSPERWQRLSQAARTKSLNVPAWGFDPALAIALRYAAGEGLVTIKAGTYELTDQGRDFAESVLRDQDVLVHEKNALRAIGKGVTEAMVDAVAKGWDRE